MFRFFRRIRNRLLRRFRAEPTGVATDGDSEDRTSPKETVRSAGRAGDPAVTAAAETPQQNNGAPPGDARSAEPHSLTSGVARAEPTSNPPDGDSGNRSSPKQAAGPDTGLFPIEDPTVTPGVRKYFFYTKEHVSSDWKDLAFHLGFNQPDIDNIAGRNPDDKSRCMDLLEEWLKHNGEKATIKVLMEALAEANLQSTVDGLKESVNREWQQAREQVGRHSTRRTPDRLADMDRHRTGRTTDRLADMDRDSTGRTTDRLADMDRDSTGRTTDRLDPDTQRFRDAVDNFYQTATTRFKPAIWNDRFTLTLGEIFTELELVQKEKQVPTQALRSTKKLSSLDDLFNSAVTGRSTAPRCILIEGEAGGGKTTFLSKEALDAASQKNELGRRHDIVLLIRLREVREGETIEEMVLDQCVPETTEGVDVQSIRAILQRNESRVLFLLDGYDELRPEARVARQAIPKLLAGKMYPKSTVVITSRPSVGVQQYTQPDCHVHIMGFSPEHVEKYVRQYFSITGNPELAEELIAILNKTRLVTDLIHTPIFLMLVCLLWEEEPELVSPGTMTGLYNNLLTCLGRKHCKREGVDMPTDRLPADLAEALLQLGKLALEALLRNETMVDLEAEGLRMNWKLLVKLGVVSLEVSASKLHPRKQLNFSHKTMQEFLAGRYVAHAPENQDIVELLKLTSITKALELSNLLQFTCGCDSRAAQAVMEELSKLSSKEFTNVRAEQFERSHLPTDRSVTESCNTYERFANLCLNILNERQEPEVLQAFSQALPIIMLDGTIYSREGAALKYYIQNLQSESLPDRLKIRESYHSRDTIEYLRQCFTTSLPGLVLDLMLPTSGKFDSPDQTTRLAAVLRNVPSLRALDLTYTELRPSSLQPLVQGFRHVSLLEELDLSSNPGLGDAGMEVLQVGLSSVPHLTVLRLEWVSMTAVGMSSLAPYMRHLAGLRELDISRNAIGDLGLESLADIIPLFTAMKVLDLRRTRISDRGMSALVKALSHLMNLQVLNVDGNNIGDSGIVSLVQTLCQPSSLDSEQNPAGDKSLTTASHGNTTLQELHIGENSGVTGAGLGRVAQLISALPELIRLDMSGSGRTPTHLSDTDAMALAQALPRLPALKRLDLRYISMEPADFQAVVQAAEEHPTLEGLLYSKKGVPEGADTSASCLKLLDF